MEMEKRNLDAEAAKLERLMKIIENMNLNSNRPNITKEELVKMRSDFKNRKNEDKSILIFNQLLRQT